MKNLNLRTDIEQAKNEITGGTRLLMFFFHRKGCEGSAKMMEETLKDDRVVDIIERETAPLSFDIDERKDIAQRYHVDWTPAFVIANEEGVELERWVGYLPVEDFIAQITLAKGLSAFHLGRYEEAEREFEMIVEEYPKSELVPEAEYFLGVARYKEKGDQLPLGDACHTLTTKYPDSLWTKRCSIWAHLISDSKRVAFVAASGGDSLGSGAY